MTPTTEKAASPGPWSKADMARYVGLYVIRAAPTPSELAVGIPGHPIAQLVSAEYADLIAAAPELLEALKAVSEICGDSCEYGIPQAVLLPLQARMREAISNAEGANA